MDAAELQRKHALEGAPDPFPSLAGPDTPRKPKAHANGNGHAREFDNSEISFPSLAAAPAPKPAKASPSPWASGTGGIRKPINRTPVFSSTLNLTHIELPKVGKEGNQKVLTLGEVMRDVMTKTKTKIEASSQRTTGATTFHIKAESERAVEAATKSITAALSPHATLTIDAPISTIGTIIGPKGATLTKLREASNNSVKVDIPRRDAAGTETPSANPDEDDEPTVSITISGPASLAEYVRGEIAAIIATKVSKSTHRIRDIPVHIVPFVNAKKSEFTTEDVSVSVNDKEQEIVVSGEREAVIRTIEALKATIEELTQTIESISISLPKRQHRLLTGKAAEDLLIRTGCAVVPTKFEEPGDAVTIWGKSDDVGAALSAVYAQAKSQHTQQFPLPGPIAYATQVQTYLTRSQYLRTLLASHPGVAAHVSSPALSSKTGIVNVDFIGDKAAVEGAAKELSELVHNLEGALRAIEIDWLTHKVLIGKNGKKIKQFQEQYNVLIFFPAESSESSTVLLVHDPLNLSPVAPTSSQKQAHLDDVQKELLKMAADAADVKSETIEVESKWHASVVGKQGTTLNAIIGEDKVLSIKVGSQAKVGAGQPPLGENDIVIRGPSAEVDRAVKEIRKIVEDAKNDEIDNGFITEFEINRDYVGRIVGAGGAAVNKLRDQLGVNLDFSDEGEEKDGDKSKKKKTSLKCKVKITGRKENVEEAKRRILSQVDKLADETSEVLKIPRSIHASLIGPSGKYVIRLEEKYGVKITFPRESEETGSDEPKGNRTREILKSDEVLVKGGKKGVAGAKSEILDAVEYEKDNNNTVKFTVPTRSVARILGRGGASINQIKDDTDAQIDVDKAGEDTNGNSTITLRGTKKAIAAARAAITAISEQLEDEVTLTVPIEARFHRSIIGAGGQNLRDIISRAGGPTDPRSQAGLVHFPRQGETVDEVKLRGPKAVVTKIKEELEALAATQRDRIVLGVAVPAAHHRALIGRGGQHLNDLQAKTGATVQFPGSRSYNSVGEPENIAELGDVDPADLVKVFGPKAACAKAIAELTSHKDTQEQRAPRTPTVTATVSVPLKYHHIIGQQGNFFRTLRNIGVNVDQSKTPEKSASLPRPPPTVAGATARIDEEESPEEDGVEWQVVPNYQDAEEGDSEWTLKARDQESLDQAQKLLATAIEHAEGASHLGYLTLRDRSVFPRIVGTKGAMVARLRAETAADITVGRDDNVITIIGTEQAVHDAKDAILKIALNNRR